MRSGSLALALVAAIGPGAAEAAKLIPGPDEPGFDEALAAKADRFVVQLHQLLTLPIGFGLNAEVTNPDTRALIDRFFESGERDFVRFAGKHPYEVIERYSDYTHAGIFGGVQIAGDAFRYSVLRDGGAPTEQVDEARAIVIRNLDALDWMARVTGVPGVIARGIRRIVPEPGQPPIPGEIPETVPLFDENGKPYPSRKRPTWREDRSGELPFLIWIDDVSRDIMDGYVFALGVTYDVVANDPTIPREKIDRIVEHARAIGSRLLERVEVADGVKIDLVIRDADGRPTTYHALSAEEFFEGVLTDEATNAFNTVMSLGMLRTLHHVSGDSKIGHRYHELIEERNYLDLMESSLTDIVYFDEITNYSNVNMLFIAFYGILRYENDPEIALRARRALEKRLYDPGVDRDARGLGMSFYDLVFAGFAEHGVEGIGAEALEDALTTLRGHASPPYWDDWLRNCDEDEIQALDCELLDGTRVRLSSRRGYGGERVVAIEPIPIHVRPPSDFMWRSDPHQVNGGGHDRLNFGGDYHAAYWMGRFLEASTSGLDNISAIARDAPAFESDPMNLRDGCACTSAPSPSAGSKLVWLALAALTCSARPLRRLRKNG